MMSDIKWKEPRTTYPVVNQNTYPQGAFFLIIKRDRLPSEPAKIKHTPFFFLWINWKPGFTIRQRQSRKTRKAEPQDLEGFREIPGMFPQRPIWIALV